MNNISLPDALRAAAAEEAARAGFPSADEYVADLVRRDLEERRPQEADVHLRRALAGEGDPAGVTEEALRLRKQEVEALLVEGLNSGLAAPMTSEDWAALKRRVHDRLNKQDGP
jgi:antitoxin ParD1/3/4